MPDSLELVTRLPALPSRPDDSHKGSYGRVLIVAGSRGMSGAAILAGGGALRGGAGLVQVAGPAEIHPILATANPCYLTALLPQDDAGRLAAGAAGELAELCDLSDAVAIGPGLGRSDALDKLIPALIESCTKPLVVDADALNALAHQVNRLQRGAVPRVLTPHPGEFARLLGRATPEVQANRQDLAVGFAAEHGIVLVLKGHDTLVTDGRRLYQNSTGNPGMASGGTGDVLTGLIAALLGQGLEAFAAAQLGVHIHGLAGDLAKEDLGALSITATDVLQYVPRAFRVY